MTARATIGAIGAEGIEGDELFRELVAQVIPVDRVQWGDLDCDYVICSGERALAEYRPDLKPGETHGRAIVIAGRVIFPVLHHDSYRRFIPWRKDLVEELRILRRIAVLRKDGGPWLELVPISCVKCRGDLYRIDDNQVCYCEEHWGMPDDPYRNHLTTELSHQ